MPFFQKNTYILVFGSLIHELVQKEGGAACLGQRKSIVMLLKCKAIIKESLLITLYSNVTTFSYFAYTHVPIGIV